MILVDLTRVKGEAAHINCYPCKLTDLFPVVLPNKCFMTELQTFPGHVIFAQVLKLNGSWPRWVTGQGTSWEQDVSGEEEQHISKIDNSKTKQSISSTLKQMINLVM